MKADDSKVAPGEAYPPAPCSALPSLFDHMSREHGLTLTDSELTEIMRVIEAHSPCITFSTLKDSLVRHGIVQPGAVDDPELYDGYRTIDKLSLVYWDLVGTRKPNK